MQTEKTLTPEKEPDKGAYKTIGLISDTHIPTRAKTIPKKVFRAFEHVDLIIHAGDLVQLSTLIDLEKIAPVLAVSGNMDKPEVTELLPEVNSTRIFNHQIGVTHDPGTLFRMTKMRDTAKKNKFSVLVYGHTHSPSVKWQERTLYINPGSPTNPVVPFINRASIAKLRIGTERIDPEIIYI